MAKVFKTSTILADENGKCWAEAELSEAQVKRLIKSYQRAGVYLVAYGSPNQVMAQLKQLEGAF